jgi:hypothetical protein
MDAARMAAMSDPLLNPQFRRRWGPPLKRISPPPTGIGVGAKFEVSSSEKENTSSARVLQWASQLDRLADAELAVGRVAQAERLAHEAAELREAA